MMMFIINYYTYIHVNVVVDTVHDVCARVCVCARATRTPVCVCVCVSVTTDVVPIVYVSSLMWHTVCMWCVITDMVHIVFVSSLTWHTVYYIYICHH